MKLNRQKIGMLFVVVLLFCFCWVGSKIVPVNEDEGKAPMHLIGSWHCDEMASDHETYTGFYALYINEDGTFSMYDDCGNPGIAGTLGCFGDTKVDDEAGVIHISCGSEDFDPPFCWRICEEAELEFEVLEGERMRLGYDGVWLTFTNDNTQEVHYFDLVDDGTSGYSWKAGMQGEGSVELEMTAVDDEDMGKYDMYTMLPDRTGDVTLTMTFEKNQDVKYQVVFELTVNENGTITRHSCEGDLNEVVLY